MNIARTIKIIDDYTIVINQGENHNIKIGDLFLIYEIGEELFDPDTGESLGELEIVKGKGKVVHVQEKISTIESIEIKKTRSIKKPIKTFSQFIAEEETFDSERIPFKDLKLNDFVKKIR